jgi:hypothetical protein
MKKYLLGIVALAVVAVAVTLVVRASDSSKESKKAKTEIVEATECDAAHVCGHEKGDKSSCDPIKCASCCDHGDNNCDHGKDHDPAKCATQCPSAKNNEKHDHSKCNH